MQFNRRTFATSIAALPLLPAFSAVAQTAEDTEMAAAGSRMSGLTQYFPGGGLDGPKLDLTWIDPERQLFDIARGEEGEERLRALAQSQFGNGPQLLTRLQEIEDLVGFGPLNIQQMAALNPPPETMHVVRLDFGFDEVDLPATWQQAGYEKKQNDLGEFWTIGEDAEIDLSNPLQRVAMASMNNIAMLDDRILGFAPKAYLLAEMMAMDAGATPAIIDLRSAITGALPENAISASLLDGSFLEFQVPENLSAAQAERFEHVLDESDEAVSPMPMIRTAAMGTTEGAALDPEFHSGDATAYAVLEVENDVGTAAEVIRWRHENMDSLISGQPYREILGEIEIEVVGDYELRISSRDAASRGTFNQMIVMGDTLMFAYREPDEIS